MTTETDETLENLMLIGSEDEKDAIKRWKKLKKSSLILELLEWKFG